MKNLVARNFNYTLRYHDRWGLEIYSSPINGLWAGNRDKTNRQAISIATSVYCYLCFNDDPLEVIQSIFLEEGIEWLNRIRIGADWSQQGVSMDYLYQGRLKTACFTQNADLAAILLPDEPPLRVDPMKSYKIALESLQ